MKKIKIAWMNFGSKLLCSFLMKAILVLSQVPTLQTDTEKQL